MAKENISLSVVLHNDSDYKDWLVELKERFYSHRLKASCATNGYLLDFYWKLGRDIEAKQYTNTYGSGFYKNLSQDLKNEMPGVKGFSPSNLKYMSYFYKLYAPLLANRQQPADDFTESLISSDIQTIAEQKQRGCVISLDNSWRITVDQRMHISCCACAYQLLCKRTTAVVRPKILTVSITYPISSNNISYLIQQQEEGES